jgi:hypothetical protein
MRLPGTRLRFDLAGQIVERGFPHSNCMRPGLDAPFAQHGDSGISGPARLCAVEPLTLSGSERPVRESLTEAL